MREREIKNDKTDMMRNYFYTLMAFAAATLTGCAINEPNDPEEYKPSSELSFTTDVDVPVKAGTRGTPINDEEDMTTMGVFASYTGTSDWSETAELNKMFNKQLTYDSGEWEYLPNEGVQWNAQTVVDRYSFFAYAPYETGLHSASNTTGNGIVVLGASGDKGIPSLTYTVPIDVTKQPDLMVATKKNVRPSGAKVQLDMKHALTSVAFQIMGNGEKVTGISITGVSTTGTLAINSETISWTVTENPTTTDFSAALKYDEGQSYYTTTEDISTDLIAGNGYLMMIPQTLTADAKVTVTMTDGTTKELSLSGHTWAPGKTVVYNIDLPVGGITLAPPGVIGYIAGSNILTLRGSKEYESSTLDANGNSINDFVELAQSIDSRGLEESTVYVAYFKFGSLVALSSDPHDNTLDANDSYIQSSDIIAGPTEWSGYESFRANPTWAGIPVYEAADHTADKRDVSAANYQSPSTGKGDPCQYHFPEGDWVTPTGYPYNGYVESDLPWKDTDELGSGVPAGRLSVKSGETGVYYPVSALRGDDGVFGSPYVNNGLYWSSSASVSFGLGHYLYFYNTVISPSGTIANIDYALAVRCVPATGGPGEEEPGLRPTPPTGGIPAEEYILSVDSNGELNLDGEGYIVYFKWGSLIAISANTPTDTFDVTDIAWAPEGYDFNTLATTIGTQTSSEAWKSVPAQEQSATTIVENVASGLGDPCKQVGEEWYMPTQAQTIEYIGTNGQWPQNGNDYYQWVVTGTASATNPARGLFPSAVEDNLSLPAAGYRGDHVSGSVSTMGTEGHYWMATHGWAGAAYNLLIESERANLDSNLSQNHAYPVRCLRDESAVATLEPPTTGPNAVPGILSVNDQGELNLDGEGKVVYFKWGSTIALEGAAANGDAFDVSDIAWVPQDFDFANLATLIGSDTGDVAYAKVPYNTGASIVENNIAGTGDPCKQVSADWRMPTRAENQDYMGGADYNWTPNGGTAASPATANFPMSVTNPEDELPAFGSRRTASGITDNIGTLVVNYCY